MIRKSSDEIAHRVEIVRERIQKAVDISGRKLSEITLVGVTKTQSAEDVRSLIQCGITEIGENRVQELLEKEPFIADLPHKTHLIGHLQRNKAKFLPGHVDMIQSVDSIKLIEALERVYTEENTCVDVLLEVNIGDETSKNGAMPKDVPFIVERLQNSPSLRLKGLMAIPPFGLGEEIRRYFQQMYRLFIDIMDEKMDNNTVNVLSMGMSSDFEYAIMEGATMIRVGTDLFGPRI